MKAKKLITAMFLVFGLVLFAGNTNTTYSQVALGVRYHSGPLTVAFGNVGYYRPVYYYPVKHHYYWPRRHYRHYYYYRHDRGRHRGWYRHHRR